MSLRSLAIFLSLASAIVIFVILALKQYHIAINRSMPPLIRAEPQFVIGDNPAFLGNPQAPITLVEFGDYECPPCRHVNGDLHAFVLNHFHTMKFTFRNFPLIQIHPHAQRAAKCAEAGRIEGHFWQTHDYLYSGDSLSDETIDNASSQNHHEAREDKLVTARLTADIQTAKEIGVDGTPSFFLCDGHSHVYKLSDWRQIERFLPATGS